MRSGVGRFGIILAIASAMSATTAGASPVAEWHAFVGGSLVQQGPNGTDETPAIAVGGDGSVYLAGSSTDGEWGPEWSGKLVRAFTGQTDVLVAKLSEDGMPEWYTFLGGTGGEHATAVVASGEKLYVGGNGEGDWAQLGCPGATGGSGQRGFVAQLNASTGKCLWRAFPAHDGKPIKVNAIAVDAGGHPYVAGVQDDRPCTAKLSKNNGSIVGTPKCVGGAKGETNGIAVNAVGVVYVTGALEFAGVRRPFVAKASATDEFVPSPVDLPLDPSLAPGLHEEVGRAIAVEAADTAYVASDNGRQAFVKKVVWEAETPHVDEWILRHTASPKDMDSARSIAVRSDADGVAVYAVGDTSGDTAWQYFLPPAIARTPPVHDNETEGWAVKLDANLNPTWMTFMTGEPGDGSLPDGWPRDAAFGVALDGEGNVYVAGHSTAVWSEADWGKPSLQHSPGASWDLHVVRFNVAGACPPAKICGGKAFLAKRAKAWGAYVSCVENGLAEHYLDETHHLDDAYRKALNDCRTDYFALWKDCCNPRFTADADTVTDNLTGLTWEKKTGTLREDHPPNDPDLRNVNNRYTWSLEMPWAETGTAFREFLPHLNGAGFGGSSGWRMPTVVELQTLMNESGDGVLPEFPNINSTGGYWSATSDPDVHGGCEAPFQCAWDVIFDQDPNTLAPHKGGVGMNGKSGGRHVRAVRGGL